MQFVMKMTQSILFIYQNKNFKIVQIYCKLMMKMNRTMSISKILTYLCSISQNIKINTFADIAYNVLVVKGFSYNIKRYV